MSNKLAVALTTTFTLADQFQDAISSSSQQNPASNSNSNDDNQAKDNKDALPLLIASSTALRSQVTKLSLLAITSPFTPSAVSTVLTALNESVLPSLVTAALLVTPSEFTKAFHAEIQILTKTTLKELSSLIGEVKSVADKKGDQKEKKEEDLTESEKNVVTVATGRVWDSCDVLVDIANKGGVGFVIRRVEEWRDLVRDALQEIEEWDPDEDGDELFDDLLGDDGKNGSDDKDSGDDDDDDNDEEEDEDTAALHARKKSTLRVFKPVAQVFPAIIANRLKNAGDALVQSSDGTRKLETLMAHLQNVPENIDEVAGALYEADWERHTEFTRKVKDEAAKAVGLLASGWKTTDGQAVEDKFTVWSKTWLKVVDEVSKSVEGDTKSG